jgi:methyl-accepting chemotaxis protein
MHQIPQWIYIAFTAVTAAGVLLQAFVLLGMLLALKGALGRLNEVSKTAEDHVIPALASARRLIEELSPQVKVAVANVVVASQNVAAVSKTVRDQTEQVSETVDELRQKTEIQAERVDEIVTGTLNSIAHATAMLQRAVTGPARQVGAVLNGLRAGFDVLRSREREAHAAADGDHFV